MGGVKLLIGYFIFSILLSIWAKISYHLSVSKFACLILIAIATTLLFTAIMLGCFKKIVIREIEMPAFKYYYFETQGTYFSSAANLSPKFEGVALPEILEDRNVKFLSIYNEHPEQLKDPTKMRACWGFAFVGEKTEAKFKNVVAMLKERGAAEKDLPGFKLACGSVPFVFMFSFIVSLKKIYPAVIDYVKHNFADTYYADSGVPFVHLPNMEEISMGYITSGNGKAFAISTIAAPERSEAWIAEAKMHNTKSK